MKKLIISALVLKTLTVVSFASTSTDAAAYYSADSYQYSEVQDQNADLKDSYAPVCKPNTCFVTMTNGGDVYTMNGICGGGGGSGSYGGTAYLCSCTIYYIPDGATGVITVNNRMCTK